MTIAAINETQRRCRSPRSKVSRWPAVVIWLICINCVIEAALVAVTALTDGSFFWRTAAYELGGFWAPLLRGVDPIFAAQPVTMFATYAFLHGGWLHLAVNMIALYSFGTAIVHRIGPRRFLIAYAVSAIGGATAFGVISNQPVPMVGASGALFGLLGVWTCWDFLDRRHYGEPVIRVYRALFYLVVYNLVFYFLLSGRLAWETHLGGFVAGWVIALYWGRPAYRSRSQPADVLEERD